MDIAEEVGEDVADELDTALRKSMTVSIMKPTALLAAAIAVSNRTASMSFLAVSRVLQIARGAYVYDPVRHNQI